MYRRFYLFITLFVVAMAIISSTIAADTNHTDSDCDITHELYSKYLGTKGIEDGKHTKTCTQPGCFYIFKQNNLWKKWAPSLFARGLKDKDETIMGCRYDIPYLIQRTHGAADRSLHKILEMLRACFIRKTTSTTADEGDRHSFCQPEYAKNTTTTTTPFVQTTSSINEAGANRKQDDDPDEAWVDRHLPSVQENCFYNFANGIFFVKSGKRNLVVCCSEKKDDNLREKCLKVTEDIDSKKWRNKDA